MTKNHFFILIIMALLSNISYAQSKQILCENKGLDDAKSIKHCSIEDHFISSVSGKREHNRELEFVDRFGHRYHRSINSSRSAEERMLPNPDYISPDGLFALYIADPTGSVPEDNFTTQNAQGEAYRNVLAQLFADIERLLVEHGAASVEPVKFEIQSFSSSSGPLGAASSYYDSMGFPTGSVIQGNVWQAINSGTNNADDWDGYIRMNFFYDWYTNFNDPDSIGAEVDMYGVLLHELMHALGFASGIDANGGPELGFYYPFDTLLQTESGVDLIVNNGSVWNFNPALNLDILTSGCDSPTTGIRLGDADFSVFAPDVFVSGTSLSHIDLNDDCVIASNDYLMAPGVGAGQTKRLDVDQINVLCDLNYLVSSSYGHPNVVEFANPAVVTSISHVNTFGIPGCTPVVFGVNDVPSIPPTDNCEGTVVILNESDLLANDSGVNGGLQITNFTDPNGNALIVVSGTAPNRVFQYNPVYPQIGTVQLRYQPMDGLGNIGNYTYVDIDVVECPGAQFGCTNSDPCNLICNSEIENNAVPMPYTSCLYLNSVPMGWNEAFVNPDWMPNDPSCVNGNQVRSFSALPDGTGGRLTFGGQVGVPDANGEVSMSTEGVSASVNNIQPATRYILSFHKNDGVNPNRFFTPFSSMTIRPNVGMNVTLSRDFSGSPGATNYTHIVSTSSSQIDNPDPQNFENNHVNIIADNTVTVAWSQTVVDFTSPADPEFELLNFSHPVNDTFYTLGNTYPTDSRSLHVLAIDRVELIEDRLQETPNTYTVDCGTTHTIGIDLCEVANMQYQWWDVTDSTTPVKLSDLVTTDSNYNNGIIVSNPATQYTVNAINANGSQIVLSNILGPVNLQLRRVFPNTFGGDNLVVNNMIAESDNRADVSIIVQSGGVPDDSGFTFTQNPNCIFSFQANETYDTHQWDFGDGAVISGPGTDSAFSNPSHAFSSPGVYSVEHTVSNECGSITTTMPIFVSCSSPCPDCQTVLNDIRDSFTETGSCGEYAFVISPTLFDCYSVQIFANGQQLFLQPGTNLVTFNENGAYTIDIILNSTLLQQTCSDTIGLDVDCHPVCDNFQPDFTFSQTSEACPLEFVGVNNGDDCLGQTYLWQVFNDANNNGATPDEEVFQISEISFNVDDFSFPDQDANYVIQFTIFDSNSDYSETVSTPWIIPDECYVDPCTDFDLDFTFSQTPEGCPTEFIGVVIGDECTDHTYLWQVFDDTNENNIVDGSDIEVFHISEISFDASDFSFPDQDAHYIVQFTVFDSGSDYSETLTVPWPILPTCYHPCISCEDVIDLVLDNIVAVQDCNVLQLTIEDEQVLNCYGISIYIDNDENQIEPGVNQINVEGHSEYVLYINNAITNKGCIKKTFPIECCPSCAEAFEVVAQSVTTVDECHYIEVTVPNDISNCFNVSVDTGSGEFMLESGVNTIENPGIDQLTLFLYDVSTPKKSCIKESVPVTCCPSCNQIAESLGTMLQNLSPDSCGNYTLEIQQSILDCYRIRVLADGELSQVETTTHPISFNTNGTHEIYLYPVLIDGNRCPVIHDGVTVNCFPMAPPKMAKKPKGVKMYPNPAKSNNSLYFELNDKEDKVFEVRIKNILGRTMLRSRKSSEINIRSLTSGVYFVSIETQQGIMYKKRLVIE